jgi:hypothetical protein
MYSLCQVPIGAASFSRVSLITKTAASTFIDKVAQLGASGIDAKFAMARKMFPSREWKRLYSDGTVINWLQQVSDFFMTEAGISNTRRASDYSGTSIYLETI